MLDWDRPPCHTSLTQGRFRAEADMAFLYRENHTRPNLLGC